MRTIPPTYTPAFWSLVQDSLIEGEKPLVSTGTYPGRFYQLDCQSVSGSKKEMHPQSFLIQEVNFPKGGRTRAHNTGSKILLSVFNGAESSSSLPFLWQDTGVSESRAYNKCIESLYNQIKSGGLNIAASAAEGHQVKDMLAHSASRVGKAVVAAQVVVDAAREFSKREGGAILREVQRSFNGRKTARKARSSAANAWLEMTYGWNPLLSDIHGLLTWAASLGSNDSIKRVTATGGDKQQLISHLSGVPSCIVDNRKSIRYKIIIDFSVDNPVLFDVSRFTSLNPLLVAWELVPYSFVVDWFFNVSGYLANMEAALVNGLSFHRGCMTRTELASTTSAYYYNEKMPDPGNYAWISGSYLQSSTVKRKDRTLLSYFPLPRLPVLSVNLGASRLLSSASLLSQFLPRR
jgi:hypothetical protein